MLGHLEPFSLFDLRDLASKIKERSLELMLFHHSHTRTHITPVSRRATNDRCDLLARSKNLLTGS
jgi:hypothetical protein